MNFLFCITQEAIADGIKAGLRGINRGAQLACGDDDGGAAAQLEAKRVSRVWLDRYLSDDQRHATACLSLFAASFDAAGAAAVLCGGIATAEQHNEAKQVLQTLHGISIIQKLRQPASPQGYEQNETAGTRYSMHPLLRDLAADLSRRRPGGYLMRLLDRVLTALGIEDLLDQVLIMLRFKQPGGQHKTAVIGFVVHTLSAVGNELVSLGQTASSAPAAAQLLGWEAPNVAAMLQMISGSVRHHAKSLLEEESQRGELCRAAMDALAQGLSHWGQLQLAERAGRVAWNARRQWPHDPRTLASMASLSCYLANLGQHQQAADMAQEALTARQRVLGPEHPDTLSSMNNLSNRLSELGQHEAAAAMARQVLEAQQRVLGPEHPDTLKSMNNLSCELSRLGQHEAAADMTRKVLEAKQRVLGPEHPDTLRSMSNLSCGLSSLGQHKAAADMTRKVLEAQQRVLGPGRPDTLKSMNNLGIRLSELGQHEPAAAMARQVLAARQRVLGPEHPDTLSSMHNLSIRLSQLGQHEAATAMARQVLEVRQRVLGPEHPDTLASMSNLSCELSSLGQHEAAADMTRKVLEAQQRVLRPEHPDTLASMSNLSCELSSLGQHEAAADMTHKVLEAQQRVLGPEHPDTLGSMHNLSMWLAELGQHQEAAEMARQALEGAAARARA